MFKWLKKSTAENKFQKAVVTKGIKQTDRAQQAIHWYPRLQVIVPPTSDFQIPIRVGNTDHIYMSIFRFRGYIESHPTLTSVASAYFRS